MVARSIAAMRFLIIFLATGCYSGYVPVAPGTAGSVVGAAIWWIFGRPLWERSPILTMALWAALFTAGCAISGRAEAIFGERDSPRIVLDEICGMAATMFFVAPGWRWLAAGFALFRLFDIAKPFPAGLIDRRMRGGAGVMFDDLAAAIYANLVLQVAMRLI
jgi:phosphatidylglycerophosphatase A